MPSRRALAFTASISPSGNRMLMRAVLGRASQLIALNYVNSRVERSWSRKASASASVFRWDTFLTTAGLSGVDVSDADGADEFSPPAEGGEGRRSSPELTHTA